MPATRVDKTDASLATALDTGGFAPPAVRLDDEHTFGCWHDTGASSSARSDDTYHFAVLHHPEAGGGSWGSAVSLPTGEEAVAACALDASTVAIVTMDELSTPGTTLYLRVATISGTTITMGAQQEIKGAGEMFDLNVDDVELVVKLSASRLLIIITGATDAGPWFLVVNLSGTTVSSTHLEQLRGTNLVTGDTHDFEGGTVGGWTSNNVNIVLTNSTAQAFEGTRSLLVDYNVSVSNSRILTPTGTSGFPVTAGRTYAAGFMFFHLGGSQTGILELIWYDAAGVQLSSSSLTSNNINAFGSNWAARFNVATAPANAAYASIQHVTGSNPAVMFHIDEVWLWDVSDLYWAASWFVAAEATDSTHVLMAYQDLTSDLSAALLDVGAASVTLAQRSVLKAFAAGDGPVSPNPGGIHFHASSGKRILAAPCDTGSNINWCIFQIAVGGGSFTAGEDPSSPFGIISQGDWSLLLDDQFLLLLGRPFGAPSNSHGRIIDYIYELDRATGQRTGPELIGGSGDLAMGMYLWGGGGQTFDGQRRLALIGPWKYDGVSGITNDVLHGKEVQIDGLPIRSVFYVGTLAIA